MTAAAQSSNIDITDFSNPMVAQLADMIAAKLSAPQAIETITFGELYSLYFERRVQARLRNTQNAYYFYSVHGPRWRDIQVSQIRRQDLQAWVDNLGKDSPSAAKRALDMMKAIINWGIKREFLPPITNPCNGVETFALNARERFILPAELTKFESALQKEPPIYRDFFHICLLTGARRGNVFTMRWDEIDFDLATWTIPGSKFKNGHTLVIPLSAWPLAILERRKASSINSTWVFPGNGKGASSHLICVRRPWKRVLTRAGLYNLRVHDLRRTLASYMAINGDNSYTIARMLGHKDARSTAVYARLDVGAVRTAVQNVSDKWEQLLEPSIAPSGQCTILLTTHSDSRPACMNANVQLNAAQQIIVESKIITSLNYRGDTKKHFYRKIGSQVPLNSAELDRVLVSMQERGLITAFEDDKGVVRYALI